MIALEGKVARSLYHAGREWTFWELGSMKYALNIMLSPRSDVVTSAMSYKMVWFRVNSLW